jgi:type IX secretion system PorP/SprF family membrane protein
MKRRFLSVWILSFMVFAVCAQDQTNFTQFYLNPFIINPSYAGIDGRTCITLIYRNQWATIPDGPRISNLSIHTPISQRVSTGLSVTNDQRGILKTSGLSLTFAYSVPFGEASFLRFGISAGGSFNTVDLKKLEGISDPELGKIMGNNSSLLGNSGLSVHLKTFHFGVAMPVIFAPAYVSKDAFSVTEIKPFQSLIFHASNRFYFNNDTYIFEPYLTYRMNADLPPQFEVAGIVHLNHVLWAGGSFKQDFGISALGGIKLKNTLAIGGSYSLKKSGINELNSPTYEVTLGLLLGKRKKDTEMYSFVNTQKEKKKKGTGKSASEMLAQKHAQEEQAKKLQNAAAKKKQDELAAQKKQQAETAKKQQEALAKQKQEEAAALALATKQKTQTETIAAQQKTQAETLKKQQEDAARDEVAKNEAKEVARKQAEEQFRKEQEAAPLKSSIRSDTMVVKHKPRFNAIDPSLEVINVEITEHTEDDEKERIARLALHAKDPDEHHGEDNHPNAERHEFAKRGNHANELPVSDYVISGVFKEEKNAKHFADGLKKLGFKVSYGHLTEKAVWYVYLHQSNDIHLARSERDRYRKMKIFRDAWLLTVHN